MCVLGIGSLLVWLRVMKLCNGREQQSEAVEEREKTGEMNLVGPATVKNGTHKKIESGFESGLDSKTCERLNLNLAWDPHKIWDLNFYLNLIY